jgi:cytochrome c oxidase subunit 3
MGLFEQLMEKSWEPLPDATVAARDRGWAYLPAAMVSLRLFLAVVGVLFGLLAIVYIERMEFADWRPLSDPGILWLNTAVLILSSVGMEWARGAAHRGRRSGVQAGLLVGGLCAFGFLAGQLVAARQLVDAGMFAATNPSVGFYYLITGLHAAHLLGGLVAWGRTFAKFSRGVEIGLLRLSVDLCALYWHFLLLVWLGLFGLLLLT